MAKLKDTRHGSKARIAGRVHDVETGQRIEGDVRVVGVNAEHVQGGVPCVNVQDRQGRHYSVPKAALEARS